MARVMYGLVDQMSRAVAIGWDGQVLLPVSMTTGLPTGKSTCPCHPSSSRRPDAAGSVLEC